MTCLPLCIDCSTAALATPLKVSSNWELVEHKMLDSSDWTRTGISILTIAADKSELLLNTSSGYHPLSVIMIGQQTLVLGITQSCESRYIYHLETLILQTSSRSAYHSSLTLLRGSPVERTKIAIAKRFDRWSSTCLLEYLAQKIANPSSSSICGQLAETRCPEKLIPSKPS